MVRQIKFKFNNNIIIIFIILIIFFISYFVLSSVKKNIYENFGDWKSLFNGYSPYVVSKNMGNLEKKNFKKIMRKDGWFGSLDQCGIQCNQSKRCIGFDTKVILNNPNDPGTKNWGCDLYFIRDPKKDKKYRKPDEKFKITNDNLSPATENDLKKYYATKFFVKKNKDNIKNIQKLKVSDFPFNNAPKPTECPKRKDCPSCYYYPRKYGTMTENDCPSKYCIRYKDSNGTDQCRKGSISSYEYENLWHCEHDCI